AARRTAATVGSHAPGSPSQNSTATARGPGVGTARSLRTGRPRRTGDTNRRLATKIVTSSGSGAAPGEPVTQAVAWRRKSSPVREVAPTAGRVLPDDGGGGRPQRRAADRRRGGLRR